MLGPDYVRLHDGISFDSFSLKMAQMIVLGIVLTSVLYLTSALRCDRGRSPRFALSVQEHSCDCLPHRAGQLNFADGKVLVCTGSEWKTLQYEGPYGSKSNPGASCEDIRATNKETINANGVYWIALNGKRDAFPVYCDMVDGGWTLAFKAVNEVQKDAYAVYISPNTYNENIMEALDVTNTFNDFYKNRIILNWDKFSPSEARVVLYEEGIMAKEVSFDARRMDKLKWFSKDKLTNSSWGDIKVEEQNHFSIEGETTVPRRFYINRKYNGCPGDEGWISVSVGVVCSWENQSNRGQDHMIMYSKLSGYTNWNNYDDVGVADVLAVYVR